ncbi:phage late control D family protein [Paenibacillus sp. PR3]|uniref:Phage late control D family protein n=1 Tax=Paenibacillus terricola TaxID=2763503 RepID=A0ABR8N4T7_9BACL|nr:phage late control D family protein [Paenibacillus terricola]MBD3922432.1 phage late control D family protein [Paenibacillus terricola]
MDFIQLEKKYGNFYAPSFEIEVAGRNLLREGMEIVSLSVEHSLGEADHFSFTIDNAYDPVKKDLKWIDTFLPAGKKVHIRMGYGARRELMLVGVITSITTRYPASGLPQLDISGFDLSHLLMKGSAPRSWDEIKHSDAVSRLAFSAYNLKSEVEDTKVKVPKLVKEAGKSDYQFIQELARMNYYEFSVFGETLHFRPPAKDSEPVVTLEWQKTLNRFEPEINLANQVAEVEVRGWDAKAKKEIVGKASIGDELVIRSGGGQTGGQLVQGLTRDTIRENVTFPIFSQEEADQLARSILNNHAEGLVTGTGETVGLPELLPGKTIRLMGLGSKFSKVYYLQKTVHTIGSGGYHTTFHVKESAI